jgi:hypothetical protein
MVATGERKSTEHRWTLPQGLANFLRVTEQSDPNACLWFRDTQSGNTIYVSPEDAGWLGQALVDFAATVRQKRALNDRLRRHLGQTPPYLCTDCGRLMREVRHENGRCADCY